MDRYPLTKPNDLFATLAGGKQFSKINLTSAYQQLWLEDESRELTTINAQGGLYKVTRLPFGVASTPTLFQKVMDTILQGLPKVICYIDDILVQEAQMQNIYRILKQFQRGSRHMVYMLKRTSTTY